jgi:hypothetical protein
LEPLNVIRAAIGNDAVTKLLASPATAASAARWTRAYEALQNQPGPRSLASFKIATRNLASTSGIADLQQRITDAVQPARAAPAPEPTAREPYFGTIP